MLKAGIVGLPNVGKSTLFNVITNSHVEAANYPFATINPNLGTVFVPDKRLDYLSSIFKPKKTTYTTFEFCDIAGLVKGASKGEGLGNQFLAHIRECDAIVEVVRCFDSNDIIHVENNVDPKRDIDIIDLELIFADLDVVNKRLNKLSSKTQNIDKKTIFEKGVLEKVVHKLSEGLSIRQFEWDKQEYDYLLKELCLLSIKPIIYVANIDEKFYGDYTNLKYFQIVQEIANKNKTKVIPISCELEFQLSNLSCEEKKEILLSFKQEQSGLEKLIQECYKTLDLSTFFTVGDDECRAWTFKNGTLADDCAGLIHTDFKKGFIKAEIYSFDDLKKYGTEQSVKENGKIRTEGKNYLFLDGDIAFFKFNVKK